MKKIAMIMVAAALAWMTTGTMNAETFVKVTDASTLKDGDKVVFGNAAAGKVSSTFAATGTNKQKHEFLLCSNATFAEEKATLDDPTVITLKASSTEGYWNFFIGEKPIGHESGSTAFDSKYKTTTDFSITINGGVASINSKTNTTYAFYYNSSSPRFALYSNANQQSIELYKLDESTVPEVVPTKVELDKHEAEVRLGGSLTLTATVTPEQAEDKSVSWGSMTEGVATVANGVVSPVAVGTAKIWVKTAKGENVTDTCIVTVLPELNTTKATYNIVQKADYLTAGAKVFFGSLKSSENYVMGRYESGYNIKVAAATYKDNAHHSVESELQYAYTVQRAGDYYVFVDQDGYYLRTKTGSILAKSTTLDEYAKWTIGEFNADDATVEIKNAGCNKYLYYNCSADLFNIYDYKGNYLGTDFTKVVLYSSEAPAWQEREKNPTMTASGDALTTVDSKLTLDWGKQEPDPYVYGDTNPWGDSRKFIITVNDLSDDVEVTLDDLTGTFYCGWVSVGIKKDRTTPAEITVLWEAASKGTYTATLKFHTETAGVDDIEVVLKAEAIGPDSEPENQPKFSASVDYIYLNPNWDVESSEFGKAEASFTFSAKNLKSNLYCKWHHDSGDAWFPYNNEWMKVWLGINNDYEELGLNSKINLGKEDRENVEVQIEVYAYNVGTYACDLSFKSEDAFEVTIPITITVSEAPQDEPTGLTNLQETEISTQKIIRDGQVLIIRNNEVYSVMGLRVKK